MIYHNDHENLRSINKQRSIIQAMKKLSIFLLLLTSIANAQTKSVLIMNGTAHIGNDSLIQNSIIGMKAGKIVLVADAKTAAFDKTVYDEVIDATGKHIYPGFIAPNSTLGLTEIEAVRATNDFRETGSTLPNVRSLIAYNTDSKIIPTVRGNGILLAQITPRGGLVSGTSSVVALDGWNWEDAAYKIDEGIHVNWPTMQGRKYLDDDTGGYGPYEKNKDYAKQTDVLRKLFADAKAYSETTDKIESNLRFEAMKGLFSGSQTLFLHCNNVKEIVEAINFAKQNKIIRVAIVGGKDSWMITDLLKENNISVVVSRVHDLPDHPEDDVDQPYKLPFLLQKAGILFCLNNEGEMEAMGARNLPFLAGTAAAYGLTKEQALRSITLNTAKILGIDKTTGSIETGKDANIFISTGDALDMRSNNVERAFVKGNSIDLNNDQKALYEKYKTKYGIK
ncbi:MAG TPA: amidohydrolase family protein [Bacteroidia bacterium]|jgi:imidazolonepropionase-like amidohydrolase